jgi:poly(3-hydroxybutyrate) depolymerase
MKKLRYVSIACCILLVIPVGASNLISSSHNLSRLGPTQEFLGGRKLLWEAPATPPSPEGFPVLILLHARFQHAESWFSTSNGSTDQVAFTVKALKNGFLIIAPDAETTTPDPHGVRDWSYTEKTINDSIDLLFIQNILTWLGTTPPVPVNLSQLFCLGFSSGGIMTSRIGHCFGNRFAAIAVCSGANADAVTTLGYLQFPIFNISAPQSFEPDFPPTLISHGILDRRVPSGAGIHFSEELTRAGIRTTLLVNPIGVHRWQSLFDNDTLHWFLYGYQKPAPPEQPTTGPGGSNYSHGGMRQTKYGSGAHEYWIFEPSDPTPVTAPLIVFNHGWSAVFPGPYKEWIEHLVRHGNIVVYPRYQRGLTISLRFATQNAIDAVKQAITILQQGDHVHPDLEKFAIVGHSLGGGITAEMAALANTSGLPTPKAVMPVQPYLRPLIMLTNFSGIPSTVLLLVVVGENDTIAGNQSGKLIFLTSNQVPISRKDYVIQRTDSHGFPPLVADHFAPVCFPNSTMVDAMDYFSTWKLFDALTDYAFYGINGEYCLGNTSQQRFMGLWSDGVPVKELVVTDTP